MSARLWESFGTTLIGLYSGLSGKEMQVTRLILSATAEQEVFHAMLTGSEGAWDMLHDTKEIPYLHLFGMRLEFTDKLPPGRYLTVLERVPNGEVKKTC